MSNQPFDPMEIQLTPDNPNNGHGFGKRMLVLMGGCGLALGAFAAVNGVADGQETIGVSDGNGSPAECLGSSANVIGSIVGSDNLVVYAVPPGYEVDGVCIKSGENMFDGATHSGLLGNGVYEDDCYRVSGVGTNSVTVERLREGPDCQGISHIDVKKQQKHSSTTTTSTTLPTTTTTTTTTLPETTTTTEGATTTTIENPTTTAAATTTTEVEDSTTTTEANTATTTTLAGVTTTTQPRQTTTTTTPRPTLPVSR